VPPGTPDAVMAQTGTGKKKKKKKKKSKYIIVGNTVVITILKRSM
jgi:hypothetical protein